MSDDRENPYLNPAYRESIAALFLDGRVTLDEAASSMRKRFDTTTVEGKLDQARADFRTIIGWIDSRCFDAEAFRALCFAAIESLEGKAESGKKEAE